MAGWTSGATGASRSRRSEGRGEKEWIERIRAQLDESVRMQMVSDVPIGAFLSGGIDSSTVVALMAAHSDRPIKTYAIGFEGEGAEHYYNELPYARQRGEALRHRASRDRRAARDRGAAAAAPLAHGRARRRQRVHHDLSRLGVRAARRDRDPVRRRRRRALRRLPALPRRLLPGPARAPAGVATPRRDERWPAPAERPAFAAP